MSIGLFIDKKHQPTEAEILEAVGPKLPMWKTLIQHIHEQYLVVEELKFLYGKKYGWALRFRVKSQLLTNLYPVSGGFTVQVNLSQTAIDRALSRNLGRNVKEAIDRANPYPEGRWLFVPVESEEDIQDIKQLLTFRAEEKHLRIAKTATDPD